MESPDPYSPPEPSRSIDGMLWTMGIAVVQAIALTYLAYSAGPADDVEQSIVFVPFTIGILAVLQVIASWTTWNRLDKAKNPNSTLVIGAIVAALAVDFTCCGLPMGVVFLLDRL